jgi:hypothetical protein
MSTLKSHIQQLLAADETEDAIQTLLHTELATPEATKDFRDQVILQSAQHQHYRKLVRENTQDYGELVRTRNKVNLALLQLADELPADAPIPALPAKEAPQGVSENRLKNRLLWLMAIAKLIVIGFTFTLYESGSFSSDQFMATVTLLVPVFVTYLSLMFKDQVERRHSVVHPDKHVTRQFERMVYGLVLVYTLLLFFVINLRGPGTISFKQMNAMLALVESGLGVYVTQVIFTIFKKNP